MKICIVRESELGAPFAAFSTEEQAVAYVKKYASNDETVPGLCFLSEYVVELNKEPLLQERTF